jgi:hypothetical protein
VVEFDSKMPEVYWQKTEPLPCVARRRGNRAGGIRTRDLLHPRQALYQAEPQPDLVAVFEIKTRRTRLFRVFQPQRQGRISHPL